MRFNLIPFVAVFCPGSEGFRAPLDSSQVLPPANYQIAFSSPVSPSNAGDQISTLTLIKAPNSMDQGQASTLDVGLANHVGGGTAGAIGTSRSVTAQAVVDGMDLQTCANQVKSTSQQYTAFGEALTGLTSQIRQSKLRVDAIDIVVHNIEVQEQNFEGELARLKDLYNTLAIRSNALGKWMSDEKLVRDTLQELYKEMLSKNSDEEARLVAMSAAMKTALQRLKTLEDDTSSILSNVATAQTAMFGWAANVTVAVNTHTTKLTSLQSAVQYRITQIDKVIPEMRNIAKRTQYIARSLGETNLAYAAASVLSHVESVLDTASTSDILMSIPA